MVAKKDKLMVVAKEEVDRVKTVVDVEARAVAAYQDRFDDTFEYKDLAHHFMTTYREQLVERIVETHLEYDISFFRHPPNDLFASEDNVIAKVSSTVDLQGTCGAQTLLLTIGKGPQCADP
ncbi:hypothetical protein Adt_39613 [Abeliophyllum distichum]|uniref:Uncharacterized protein n=1 Tax=Abeliophyllum distichum TaxID=126358 RepID=A0ABD1Q5L1_9LAMI